MPTKAKMIHRLRITCVSGPWLDDECVRFIDLPDGANLYDLHLAIQDSVLFDDEYPFYYFTGISHRATGKFIPGGFDPELDEIDRDVYEEIAAMDYIQAGSKESLFYVFMSEGDDWHFRIQHTGKKFKPVQGEEYPLVQDQLAQGPNPEQYGGGFDDFAEDDDHFKPMRGRGGLDGDDPYGDEDEEDEDGMFDLRFDDDDDSEEDDEAYDEEEDDDNNGY